MKSFRVSIVLLLAALWLPTTSHVLPETAGLIHELHGYHDDHHTDAADSHEHNRGDHDAADGLCRIAATQVMPPVPAKDCTDQVALFLMEAIVESLVHTPLAGPSPPGQAPLEFSQQWQFSHRAALPARAPSFASQPFLTDSSAVLMASRVLSHPR